MIILPLIYRTSLFSHLHSSLRYVNAQPYYYNFLTHVIDNIGDCLSETSRAFTHFTPFTLNAPIVGAVIQIKLSVSFYGKYQITIYSIESNYYLWVTFTNYKICGRNKSFKRANGISFAKKAESLDYDYLGINDDIVFRTTSWIDALTTLSAVAAYH